MNSRRCQIIISGHVHTHFFLESGAYLSLLPLICFFAHAKGKRSSNRAGGLQVLSHVKRFYHSRTEHIRKKSPCSLLPFALCHSPLACSLHSLLHALCHQGLRSLYAPSPEEDQKDAAEQEHRAIPLFSHDPLPF